MSKKGKKILYLGLDPTRFQGDGEIIHCPVIRIVPRTFQEIETFFQKLDAYTHFLFTSRTAVEIFMRYAQKVSLHGKIAFAIGQATALRLEDFGIRAPLIAERETAEGVLALLEHLDLKNAYVFYPRSALARDVIVNYLEDKKINYHAPALYDTLPNSIALPDLSQIDEIIFTSPSTVNAFLKICPHPPKEKCVAIGPITKAFLIQNL